MDLISETKDKLKDIQRLHREIHRALDLIEEQRNTLKPAHTPDKHEGPGVFSNAEMFDSEETSSVNSESNGSMYKEAEDVREKRILKFERAVKKTGKLVPVAALESNGSSDEPVDGSCKQTKLDKKPEQENSMTTENDSTTTVSPDSLTTECSDTCNTRTDNSSEGEDMPRSGTVDKPADDRSHLFKPGKLQEHPTNDKAHLDPSSSVYTPSEQPENSRKHDKQTRPKGILKTPDRGSKDSYGFKERLNLKTDHVMYGSQLRRTSVELNQDNRLCDRFDLDPNIGCVYESKRSLPKEDVLPQQQSQLAQQDRITEVSATSSKSPTVNANSGQNQTKRQDNVKGQGHVEFRNNQEKKSTPGQTSSQVRTNGQTKANIPQESKEAAKQMKTAGPQTDRKKSREELVEYYLKQQEQTGLELGVTTEMKRKIIDSLLDDDGQLDMEKCLKNMQQEFSGLLGQQELGAFMAQQVQGQTRSSTSRDEESDDEASGGSHLSGSSSYSSSFPLKPAPEEQSSEDENEGEPLMIDPGQWIQIANQEIENGRVAREVRERGMDTIFCLDVSKSMKGVAWQQATDFIKKFIEGIQDSTLMDGAFEHVALVTFGSETRVQQHLTCDYVEVVRKLDKLKPGGPTPMYAGLQMTHATIIGSGAVFMANGFKIHPRVYLISDGKATPAGLAAGPDKCKPHEFQMEHIPVLGLVKELHTKFHINIHPVPVGSFNLTMLEGIAKCSKGKIISPEDWKLQSRSFKNYLQASKVGALAKVPELAPIMLDAVLSNAEPEDKVQMEEFLKTHKHGGSDSSDNEEDDLPPLGSRVHLRSSTELGTVTKHLPNGFIGITWDKPRANGQLHEGMKYDGGNGHVMVVDKPRILHDEMITVGCRVKRGKDWRYPDQDGGAGNLGTVYKVEQNGWVKVRWDNGHKNGYRFGMDGCFDLETVGQKETNTGRKSEETLLEEMNKRNMKWIMNADTNSNEPTGAADSLVGGATSGAGSTFEDIMNAKNTNTAEKDTVRKADRKENLSHEDIMNSRNAGMDNVSSKTIVKSGAISDTSNVQNGHGSTYSVESAGAKPKAVFKSRTEDNSGVTAQWFWQDGDTLHPFPTDVNDKIESDFQRNSKGTSIVRLNNEQFRIVFPRMEQVNIKTKEKQSLTRRAS